MKNKILFTLLMLISTPSLALNGVIFNIDNKSVQILSDDTKTVVGFKCDDGSFAKVKYAYVEKDGVRTYNTEDRKLRLTLEQSYFTWSIICPKG